ncbi:hypothetical protein Tsubulata_018580 [Turnera subulata]|uniref:30S ribosomal protein 3, chloroplastic n=1 Tax=Turnera subulata TaxID=218843 RepID=A0A9Q0G3Z4_9ROSI|nr:hypothetical protein Tsubulata_018580 [Turnera subulata]
MLSLAVQSGGNGVFTFASLPCQTPSCKPLKATNFTIPKCNPPNPPITFHQNNNRPISLNRFRSFAAPEALTAENPTDAPSSSEEEFVLEEEVAERNYERPRLVLKFIWMEKNIALGLDQMIPGVGTVPLSPYFFWPRKDAWEELKTTLESKPWISQKTMIIILNQATDIINLWQQSGGNITA